MNFNRRDRIGEPADPPKTALKPAIYEPPGSPASKPAPATAAEPAGMPRAPVGAASATTAPAASGVAPAGDVPQSRLFVGVHIKLKGVEISDCDAVVIEGNVEATVHSKALEIAPPGTLHGTADIDVAEIHGEFAGDLTVRTRLVIHGTGRVSGTIRYGKLVVAEGGEISGDVRRRDESDDRTASGTSVSASAAAASNAGVAATTGGGTRGALAPSSERWSN